MSRCEDWPCCGHGDSCGGSRGQTYGRGRGRRAYGAPSKTEPISPRQRAYVLSLARAAGKGTDLAALAREYGTYSYTPNGAPSMWNPSGTITVSRAQASQLIDALRAEVSAGVAS